MSLVHMTLEDCIHQDNTRFRGHESNVMCTNLINKQFQSRNIRIHLISGRVNEGFKPKSSKRTAARRASWTPVGGGAV
jgi:hypothetical protein